MTDKELIKQEIERLFDEYPMLRGMLKHLTIFIDSLPEEPVSEDLEEELDNFLKDPVFGKLINRNAGIVLAHHFAEWQKQRMIEKVVKWLEENLEENHKYYSYDDYI